VVCRGFWLLERIENETTVDRFSEITELLSQLGIRTLLTNEKELFHYFPQDCTIALILL
jgi:adenylate cyclase class IV